MAVRKQSPARALCPAHRRRLAARAVADVRGNEVRLRVDGGSRVGLGLTSDLGAQRVEVHRIDQPRRIARVANTRVLAIDEEKRKCSARIVLIDDLLFLVVKLLQVGPVVGLQLFRREIEIVARVRRVNEIVGGNQVEPECVLIVSILAPSAEATEFFEAADQRPSLRGAVGSTLNPEEEHAYLVAGPGRLRDHLECSSA